MGLDLRRQAWLPFSSVRVLNEKGETAALTRDRERYDPRAWVAPSLQFASYFLLGRAVESARVLVSKRP